MDILTNVFDEVYVPSKVYDEVMMEKDTILEKTFFVKKEIRDKELYKLLRKNLGAGESEAITLAKELELSLIIDEKKGRKIALNLGVNITGFIGILILNYKKQLLSSSESLEVFNRAKEAGFRAGKNLEQQFVDIVSKRND